MSLTPILVAGYGRSGTTALMELFGTSERIAFDRRYPFENRWLTYLAKSARLASSAATDPALGSEALCDFDALRLGGIPWPADPIPGHESIAVSDLNMFAAMWRSFSERARERFPGATHYAEKAPAWLSAAVRDELPVRTIHLVRDPRDVLLSIEAFNRKRGSLAFGRKPGDSEREFARNVAHALLLYFENQRAERDRPDCLTVRFEDLIADRPGIVDRLSRFLDLQLSGTLVESAHLPMHRTTSNIEASVGRWRREPLSMQIQHIVESLLTEGMTANGYDVSGDAQQVRTLNFANCGPSSADGTIKSDAEGALAVEITGPDFWIEGPVGDIDARNAAEIWLCLRGNTGDHCSLFWRRQRESFDEGRCVHVPFQPGRHWQIVRFPVTRHQHWHGTIVQLRLDLFNGAGAHGSGQLRWARIVS